MMLMLANPFMVMVGPLWILKVITKRPINVCIIHALIYIYIANNTAIQLLIDQNTLLHQVWWCCCSSRYMSIMKTNNKVVHDWQLLFLFVW